MTKPSIPASQAAYWQAWNDLQDALLAACPGGHRLVLHADRRTLWCPACCRTETGGRAQ